MGIFDKLKNVLGEVAQTEAGKVVEPKEKAKPKRKPNPKTEVPAKPAAESKKTAKNKVVENLDKVRATKKGEPWVRVLSMELDPNDPSQGAFELDWNDKFVANLVRAGYQGKTDADIVDNWFQSVCRNIVLETWEQEQADPEKRQRSNNRRDLGNGRTEVS